MKLAHRMLKVKRSIPVPRAPLNALDTALAYYRNNRSVVCSIAAGLLLAAVAGWAKHRKLI